MRSKKIYIGGAWINTENLYKIVSSMENPNIYLYAKGLKIDASGSCTYMSHPIYKKNDQPDALFAIPVIEELEDHVKSLKKGNNCFFTL